LSDLPSIKLSAVGDIALGDQTVCYGYGVRSAACATGYDALFSDIKKTWHDCDVVMGNLEFALASPSAGERSDFFSIMNRGMDGGADALAQAGVGLVSVANNHIFEHGPDALKRTLANLERVGIAHVGSRTKPVVIKEMKGMSLAFLSWSLLPDVYWPDENPSNYYNVTSDIQDILGEVAMVRETVDRVVLSLHWGNEFIRQPSKDQQISAHRLIDGGVDVIIGHHPHILQPIETYEGGIIVYSLGNCIFDHWERTAMTGAVVRILIGDRIDYELQPLEIDRKTYIPAPLHREDGRAKKLIEEISRLHPLDRDEYNRALYAIRCKYRVSLIMHFVRNIHRYDLRDLLGLLIWGMKRIIFIFSIIGKEKKTPGVVYEGPIR